MTEQHKYYTLTEDVKTLIQYAKNHAIDHPVVKAANRLNWAIKKDLKGYGIPVTPIKQSKDSFKEEKLQYAEDCKTHEKPWELWQYAVKNRDMLDWCDLSSAPIWKDHLVYRRKQNVFVPEYYSGLNWKDAEHLIGKTVECTNHPDSGWHVGLFKLTMAHRSWYNFSVNIAGQTESYLYIRTCEETFKHPTINIGGIDLPMPETFALEFRTKYWLSPTCTEMCWNCAPSDIDALQAGQVHLTEERAKAWTDWWKKEVLAKIEEIGH